MAGWLPGGKKGRKEERKRGEETFSRDLTLNIKAYPQHQYHHALMHSRMLGTELKDPELIVHGRCGRATGPIPSRLDSKYLTMEASSALPHQAGCSVSPFLAQDVIIFDPAEEPRHVLHPHQPAISLDGGRRLKIVGGTIGVGDDKFAGLGPNEVSADEVY
jgi:hypothetical protein